MLQFNSISLYHFKNYTAQKFLFDKNIVCLVGPNGCGKTSVLDAIHFLCFTKSYFLHSDLLSVKKDTQGMRIEGQGVAEENDFKIECILRENGKKEMKLNDEIYLKFSNHIGQFPCIMICPDDICLITEGSEVRRKYLDIICSMLNTDYINNLNQYNKILMQRNTLLKSYQGVAPTDLSLLDIYDNQLNEVGQRIFEVRQVVASELAVYTQKIYNELSNYSDIIQFNYQSSLSNQALKLSLRQNLMKDIFSQRTNYGIHKDDLIFKMNDMPLKQVASQGQRKSFIFGIKLAQFHLIEKGIHKKSILLLDDLFEKLDEQRVGKLIQYIKALHTQIFITDTHADRINKAFESDRNEIQLITLA